MAQVQFGAGVVLVADLLGQGFHFLRQDSNATTHFVITHFRDDHLFADLGAIGVVVQAVIGQTATHLIERHVVLFGDISDSLVKLFIADFHAHFLAHLQHNLIHDQTFQNLMTQRAVIRELLACLVGVKLYRLHEAINVTFQYHAVVHDGCNFIDNLRSSEAGIHHQGDTEKQRFPVLHTFSISFNRKAEDVSKSEHYMER